MARGHHRETNNPSQRQLRVGELVRQTILLVPLLVFVFPAMAEVCDKVAGEQWRPTDGPVGTYVLGLPLIDILPLAAWTILFGIFCLLILVIFVGGQIKLVQRYAPYVGYLSAAFLVIAALIELINVAQPDAVHVGAVKEGCMTVFTEWTGMGILILAATLIGLAAYRIKRIP